MATSHLAVSGMTVRASRTVMPESQFATCGSFSSRRTKVCEDGHVLKGWPFRQPRVLSVLVPALQADVISASGASALRHDDTNPTTQFDLQNHMRSDIRQGDFLF